MTTPDGIVVDCSGPYPGTINDSEMARRSMLETRLGMFANFAQIGGGVRRMKIYGDSAYAASDYIEKPFPRGTASRIERRCNRLMSGVRVSVEHLIGSVTQVFPALDMARYQRTGQVMVGTTFLVSVIMRNFLTCVRGGNQVSGYFNLTPPTIRRFARARQDVNPRVLELNTLAAMMEEN